MRYCVIILALLIVGAPVSNQKHRPAPPIPDHLVIARDTFFDFGPPFHYLELFFIGPNANGSSIERILLTPQVDACTQPATVEVNTASTSESPSALLGSTNPCTIPEKELTRELKRGKRHPVFSGANVVMQVQCGDQTRLIRADILDRDLYSAAPNTPDHTSWTIGLLGKLDQAIGHMGMERSIITISKFEEPPKADSGSPNLREVFDGKYDQLFSSTTDKPSAVYHEALALPPMPSVGLLEPLPIQPVVFALPEYPMIARAAGMQGSFVARFKIDADGAPFDVAIESGPALLQPTVKHFVTDWKFPKDSAGRQIQTTIVFSLNCKRADHP
jgi:hypothetical protein